MTEERENQLIAGAVAMARRHVAMAMARMGRPDVGDVRSYLPTAAELEAAPAQTQAAPAPAPAPAPKKTPPAPAAKSAAEMWRRTIDRANGKASTSTKASGLWSKVVARRNAETRAERAA